MTLGRTASNAIKIKTDGGAPRAVECACCLSCGFAVPTPPVDDPDFFLKLSGGPSVTPFTNVSIDYSIGSSNGATVSGSHSGQWSAPTNCAPGSPYIRVADFSCQYGGCGINGGCDETVDPNNPYAPLAVGDLFLALSPGNTLSFVVTEQVLVVSFLIASSGVSSPTITINGQAQFSCVDPGFFGGTVFGFADLVFS